MKQKSRYKVGLVIALVLAIAGALWFVSPVKALEITFPSLPSSGTLGSSYSFTVKVDVEDWDILPVQRVDLYIYRSNARGTYEAYCTDLPVVQGVTTSYSDAVTGGGAVDITALETGVGWGYGFGNRRGYGYDITEGWGYHSLGGWGYGYGYATGTGATSITYSVDWTSPSGWPAGGYKIEVRIKGNGNINFTQTSDEFTLSAAAAPGAPAPPAPTPPEPSITDVSEVVTSEGVFTETVTAESIDGLAELTIDEGTVGLVDGDPISEISMTEMELPPPPPLYANVIGLVYDFGPDGATFAPPITLTFTYDELLIPEGVAEESLVIAMWDAEAGEWVVLEGCVVDPDTNTITVPVSHFTAFTVLAYTRPADFIASDFSLTPTEVDIGEKVTISFMVTNAGDLSGTYAVTLKINNVVVDTEDVTLASGASRKVTFTTSKDVAGGYVVKVAGLSGTFVVKAPPAPPEKPPVKPPPEEEVPVKPPVTPPVPPAPWWSALWWIWVIVGVVVVGLVVWLVLRRRAT